MTSRELKPSSAGAGSVYVRSQLFSTPTRPPHDLNLSGKVAIVTGGNSGIGFEAAGQLLSLRLSHLLLAVRAVDKGEECARKLRAKYIECRIDVWYLDMSSPKSVRAFAARVEKELSRIDIVMLNASIMKSHHRLVPETGHEETIQVNYLSTVLLIVLLLPILKAQHGSQDPARLTVVNSSVSLHAKLPNGDGSLIRTFDAEQGYDGWHAYCLSKLLTHFFLWRLVDFVPGKDVIVNAVDPGLVKGTNLHRDKPGVEKSIFAAMKAMTGRSLGDGASTYLDAALVKGAESHGCYIQDWKIHPFAPILYTAKGKQLIEQLWKDTMDELGDVDILDSLRSMDTIG